MFFYGSNYKRWSERVTLWLTVMNIMQAVQGSPNSSLQRRGDNLFRDAIISVQPKNLVDTYLTLSMGKDVWDALEAKFGVSDAGSELYVMEQFYDYKMVDDRSVVEQTHEIQVLAKDLEHYCKNAPCVLPDKFVAGGIIAKRSPSWRDFATYLKHKRQEFSIANLIGTLDVEERARAKDTREKGFVESSSANFINPHKKKKENKPLQPNED